PPLSLPSFPTTTLFRSFVPLTDVPHVVLPLTRHSDGLYRSRARDAVELLLLFLQLSIQTTTTRLTFAPIFATLTREQREKEAREDRKSTRLNSSHQIIS